MQSLGLTKRSLHNAGNDALYTLKALLMLFHKYKIDSSVYEDLFATLNFEEQELWDCQLDTIRRIAVSFQKCPEAAYRGRRFCVQPRPLPAAEADFLDSTTSEDNISPLFD